VFKSIHHISSHSKLAFNFALPADSYACSAGAQNTLPQAGLRAGATNSRWPRNPAAAP